MNTMKHFNYLRILLYIGGLNILALGTVLFTCGHLGVSALVSVPQVLSLFLPFTLGEATTLTFVIFVLIELCLQWRIEWQIVSQLFVAFVFGWIVDFYGLRIGIEKINLQALWEQILVTLLAIIFTSLGVFMMVKANFILNPPDGIVNVFCKKLKYSFGKTKFGFDLTMIIISVGLSLIFINHITAIGIGTILAVLLVGPFVNLWEHLLVAKRKLLTEDTD
ncbi:hypothetical protein CRI84_02300 [Liquorilactobacillus hordei]|nr:hypothetical protein [Liquorilactobacillus hordei]